MGITRKLLLGAALAVLGLQGQVAMADNFHGEVCTKDKDSVECATAKAWMRRNHPDVLKHGRNKTMREGVRARNFEGDPTRFSIRGCVSCHIRKDKETGKYPEITSPKHHCAGCHQAAAVTLDCFECHSTKPDEETLKRLGISDKSKHGHDTHSHEVTNGMNTEQEPAVFDFNAAIAANKSRFLALTTENSGAMALNGVLFETGSANLVSGSEEVLAQIVSLLPDAKFELSGHADNTGNAESNSVLSAKRAQAVVDYLVSKGAKKENLTAVGYGSAQPVADNATLEGRKQNRRVELKRL